MQDDVYVVGMTRIYRLGPRTFIRGFELREAIRQQGLPMTADAREFRGIVIPQEGGVAIMISRRRALSLGFSYVAPHVSFQHNFWVGYSGLNTRENSSTQRMSRLVMERLEPDWKIYMEAARSAGFRSADELPAYHRQQLQIGVPFR